MGLLNRLAGFCDTVHQRLEIPPEQLHWSDSLHWMLVRDILVFSGSDSVMDWYHNLKIWSADSPTGPGKVHSGFLGLARKTWPQLKETVLGGRRIKFVTGYSLGAAVALLVAEKLEDIEEVVTFACPAVGNKAWAFRYPHKVTRCWVSPDLLTTPLWNCHIGREVRCPGGWDPIKNHRFTLDRNWDYVM